MFWTPKYQCVFLLALLNVSVSLFWTPRCQFVIVLTLQIVPPVFTSRPFTNKIRYFYCHYPITPCMTTEQSSVPTATPRWLPPGPSHPSSYKVTPTPQGNTLVGTSELNNMSSLLSLWQSCFDSSWNNRQFECSILRRCSPPSAQCGEISRNSHQFPWHG